MADSTTMEETDATTTERLREQTTKVKEDVRELGRLGREVSQEKFEQCCESTGGFVDKGRDKVQVVEDKVVTYVREKPVKSLAMAIGAGALLGFLLRRR
jgi:ElaB/YqjD/DUF883 family membrane-anchored ribosome-binding protein